MAQVVDRPVGEQAREALARHAWAEAFDLLSGADARGVLSRDELDLLAQASWWTGRLPGAIEARERAYALYTKAADDEHAATMAILLARDNLLRNQNSIASAWLKRAERLLEGKDEGRNHGWLAVSRAFQAGLAGQLDVAAEEADRAYAIARRVHDPDLMAQAMSSKGLSLIYGGHIEEGLALADEAAVAAVAGEVEPLTAGSVCCGTISACTSIGDWPRVLQWTEAQDRWCRREQINGFPGMCRLYRAEAKRLRGDWLAAEAEARRASDELQGFVPAAIGVAMYEIGTIRLRRGDLPAAEEALERAHSFGRDPQPALSLLRLAQGRTDEARASIRRALDEPPATVGWGTPPGSDLQRISLIPAQIEIELAAGDVSSARAAADELDRLVERFPTSASRAVAACARGLVLVAEGSPAEAARLFRQSIQLWSDLDAPWETARARTGLAAAYAAMGDRDGAALELRAARAAFDALGAGLDRRRADEQLASLGTITGASAPVGQARRAVKTFVFTDIVDSTRLAELLGDEAWGRLLHWHDETLRSLAVEHGGEVVKSTGDGFFLAFDEPSRAIDVAIAIQRRLAEQGRTQGFAPAVRIGLLWGEATRSGSDYHGNGVNQAARIGALASGGEILASVATLQAAGRSVDDATRRTVELKGIAEPVDVASVAW